jgi:hypothetical protein
LLGYTIAKHPTRWDDTKQEHSNHAEEERYGSWDNGEFGKGDRNQGVQAKR